MPTTPSRIPPPSAFAPSSTKAKAALTRREATASRGGGGGGGGDSLLVVVDQHESVVDTEETTAAGVSASTFTTPRGSPNTADASPAAAAAATKGAGTESSSEGTTPTAPQQQRPRCPSSAMETERDYEIGEFLLDSSLGAPNGGRHPSEEHLGGGASSKRWWCCLSRRCAQSLAVAPTTPCLVAWGIPLLVVATHILFYHGQTADMWLLKSAADVDCWYNATSLEAKGVYRLIGLGDPYDLSIQYHETSTVQTFTYYTAIQELWDAAGMNVSVFLPRLASILLILFSGVWPHLKLVLLNVGWLFCPNSPRLFWWLSALGKWSLSDVLVVCVMLGVLHVDWDIRPDALLNGIIDQAPTLLHILPGLYTNSQICTQLLGRACDESRMAAMSSLEMSGPYPPFAAAAPVFLGWDLKCSACLHFVESSLAHPSTFQSTIRGVADGIATSGGGRATLRVQGLPGIYSFCAAVVLSIALSCIVDLYALKAASSSSALARTQPPPPPPPRRGRQQSLEHPLLLLEEEDDDNNNINNSNSKENGAVPVHDATESPTAPEVELGDSDRAVPNHHHHPPHPQRSTSSLSSHSSSFEDSLEYGFSSTRDGSGGSCHSFWRACGAGLAIVTCAIVYKTLPAPALLRQVTGVGPHWLQQLTGVQWDVTFSLQSLAQAVGEAGGMDVLLQATFAWFCLIGPAVRASLCVLALCWPGPTPCGGTSRRLYGLLLAAIEFGGAFCAVEVLAVAAYLVHLLIPSTTATIVNVPQCAQIAPASNATSSECFQIFLEPQEPFEWLVIGTVLLLLVSQVPPWLLRARQGPRQDHHHRL